MATVPRNPLTAALLNTISLARERADTIARLRELLHVSLDLLHTYGRTIDRLRLENRRLREQRRSEAA